MVREIEEKAVVSDLDKRHVQPLHCAKAQHLRGIISLVTQSYHFTHYNKAALFSELFMHAGLKQFSEKLDAVSK